MTNWGVIGHEWAIDYLRQSLVAGRGAHAYLLLGPARIGKALIALRTAQALNCEEAGSDPCGVCRSCRRIERGNHPDVRVASMATQGRQLKPEEAARQKDLKIDTIREWIVDINLRPYEGRRRVFILHDAERLTEAAANALLKTLEEPPPSAILILVANTAGDLLPTVVSRCRSLKLRPVPRTAVCAALVARYQLPEPEAALLAALCNGRAGWALQLAATPEERDAYQAQIDSIAGLTDAPRIEGMRWAEERAKEYRTGEQSQVIGTLEYWQAWWRDVLMMSVDCEQAVVHIDRRAHLAALAARHRPDEIRAFIVRLGQAAQQLRENVNPQLALEHVILHLPSSRAE